MTFKDLSAFLAPALKLPWKDRVFEIQPPSKEDGLLLAALNATGIATYINEAEACTQCGRAPNTHEVSEKFQMMVEQAADRDLGEVSLGAAYREMLEVGVPGADVDMFALYALYFWTMGETAADAILDARYGVEADGDPKGNPPSPSLSGPSSE